jgi:hypothetical protein
MYISSDGQCLRVSFLLTNSIQLHLCCDTQKRMIQEKEGRRTLVRIRSEDLRLSTLLHGTTKEPPLVSTCVMFTMISKDVQSPKTFFRGSAFVLNSNTYKYMWNPRVRQKSYPRMRLILSFWFACTFVHMCRPQIFICLCGFS